MGANTEWTSKWPTKPGRYWFYGWPYGRPYEVISNKPIPPELNHVDVWKVSNGLAYVRDGNFWDKNQGAVGLFIPAGLPVLPDVEPMRPPLEKKPCEAVVLPKGVLVAPTLDKHRPGRKTR
jgi:hypothetical protein